MPIVMTAAALLSLGSAAQTTTLWTCVEIHLACVVTFNARRDFLQALVGAVP